MTIFEASSEPQKCDPFIIRHLRGGEEEKLQLRDDPFDELSFWRSLVVRLVVGAHLTPTQGASALNSSTRWRKRPSGRSPMRITPL